MMRILRTNLGISLVLLSFLNLPALGQVNNYNVFKASFSSNRYDEFCPVYYKGGIVFCSNLDVDFLNKYSNQQGQSFFKILYIDTSLNKSWKDARLFSKELKTKMNDGPVSFSIDRKTIYFSRNIYIEGSTGELSSPRNKLGIFYSQYDGVWKKPTDFRYNNEWYNITSPCISPDGTKLFFTSDKPGGYGGTDLYFCQWINGYWSDPVNLGPLVNTSGNESYPFMCRNGELFFSSDKHGGLGGKDIFFTKYIDSLWQEPVHLNAPINSKYDDFGLITDPAMKSGYFSSNRDGSFDIFSFNTVFPQFFYCKEQKINQYCLKFKADSSLNAHTSDLFTEWDFGDSKTAIGEDVDHCFQSSGVYNIKVRLVDRQTGYKIFTRQQYTLELKQIEQPFISSDDYILSGEEMVFDAAASYTPGQAINEYFWDFGDGNNSHGRLAKHRFASSGLYNVTLGLLLRDNNSGELSLKSVYKVIRVFNNANEENSFISLNTNVVKVIPEVTMYDHALITYNQNQPSVDHNVFFYEVEIVTSKNHLDAGDSAFKNLINKYYVKEVYQPESDMYRYIVSEEFDFLRSYQILKNIFALGYKNAVIQKRFLTTPEEKDLYTLENVYGNSADNFFGKQGNRLTSAGIAYLDQIVAMLNRYPETKLLIESHTNRAGNPSANLSLSVQRADAVAKYLVGRGISINRLIPRGYGDKRPLSLNNSEVEKNKDQRIDMMIIK
mgnify:CR=1 FL=1